MKIGGWGQVEFWSVYEGFNEHLLPVKSTSLTSSQAGPLCKHAHIHYYVCSRVCLCGYESIRSLLWLPVSFHSVSYSSRHILLGYLQWKQKISELASFVCCSIYLSTKIVSLCKSFCGLTDRFIGVTTRPALPEMQCDVIVHQWLQEAAAQSALHFSVWSCLWLGSRGGWRAPFSECT